jgi:hypothetical protein
MDHMKDDGMLQYVRGEDIGPSAAIGNESRAVEQL